MTAWLMLHYPTFDVDNELCACNMIVVASFSNVLFWPHGAASELGFPTTLLGASTAVGLALPVHCGSGSSHGDIHTYCL